MSQPTTVAKLAAGQVMSMPGSGLAPSIITAISQPIGDCRMIYLQDLATGEPVDAVQVLGLQRDVVVHTVTVEHHYYRNITDHDIELPAGRRWETAAPGDVIHFTGEAMPEKFPATEWEHGSEPVGIETEEQRL